MKKTIIFLATAAIAALASVSCTRELSAPEAPVGPQVSVRISAAPEEAAEVDPSTRTYINETAAGAYEAKWSNSGEALGLILGDIDSSTKSVTLESEPTTDNNPVFTGKLNAEDGTYNYFVFYPASAFAACYNDGSVGFNLKDVQNPVLGSFDPTCDLMGYSSDDAIIADGSLMLEGISLQRPMAILRINLNADSDAKAFGQKVTSLKMQVPSDLVLTGRAKISAAGMDWTIQKNYVQAEIDLNEEITVGESDGINAVYLVVNPVLIPAASEINFIVETEDYNGATAFNRTVTAPSDMQLQPGNVNVIGLKLRDKDLPTVSDKCYVKVHSDVELIDGQYLIVYEEGSKAFDGNISPLDANNNCVDVVISDETIPSTSTIDASAVTISVANGTIMTASGLYIGCTSDENKLLSSETEQYTNEISINDDAEAVIKGSGGAYLRFNASSGANRFRYFKSATYTSQKAVALYRLETDEDLVPRIIFAGAQPMTDSNSKIVTKTVSASETSVEFTFYKNRFVTELPEVRKWSYTGAWFVQDGGWEVTDGKVTFTLEPNTTEYSRNNQFIVLAPCFTDDARMYLLIKQEAYTGPQVMTVKSLNDQIREDNKTAAAEALEYTGTIDNVVVTGVKGDYAFAEDATGGILLFKVSGLAAGVKASGETTIKAYMYKNMPEAVSLSTSGLTLGVASNIPCAEYTSIADLTDSWNDKMSMRSVLKGMTVTAAFSNYNATVSDAAGNTLTVRDYAKSGLSLTVGDVVSITGYPAQYNDTKQFAVLDAADIVPFTDPDTPSLSVSPESLSWGASETDAKTVTVTLNENASGYTVSPETDASWNISDNGQGVITVSPKDANRSTIDDKTLSLVIAHKDDANVSKTVHCTQAKDAAITIADILSGGANTYTGTTDQLLVYSVKGANVILGDNSGKILYYKSNHGLSEGDVITITNPAAKDYNGILEIYDGTVDTKSTGSTVDHGTPVNLNDATAASSTYSTFSATGYHSAVFISMTGTQSGRNITGSNPNTTLYLNVADATHDGKTVNVTGYVYSWYASKSNYNFQAVSIEEDSSTPTLEVNPAALTWTSDDTSSKTITVTLNADASGMDYSYTSTSGDATAWNIQMGSGAMTVSPKATNTGTSDKVLVLKVTHVASSSVYKEVTLTQKAPSSTGGDPVTVTIVVTDYAAANNWDTAGSTAYTIQSGDVTLTPSYTGSNPNGVYFGTDWRFYQARGGGMTVSVPSNKELVEATFTYNVTKTGILLDPEGEQLPSGTTYSLSGQSALFTVGNTAGATAGQVRFTQLVVVYK